MSKVGDITRRGLERALSNEVIVPGKTTYMDVSRWLEEHRESMGLRRTWYPSFAFVDDGIRRIPKILQQSRGTCHSTRRPGIHRLGPEAE